VTPMSRPVIGRSPMTCASGSSPVSFRYSSLKKRAGVKPGFGLQFRVRVAVCRA
jgi:hypothetical protein